MCACVTPSASSFLPAFLIVPRNQCHISWILARNRKIEGQENNYLKYDRKILEERWEKRLIKEYQEKMKMIEKEKKKVIENEK